MHYLKKHLVGRTISAVKTQEDDIIYGKVGTSASAFQKAMTGKKVVGAKQQGKYFWLEMDTPPHPLMHLGMTGWMRFNNDDTAYYKPAKKEEETWPPRFWKFVLELKGEDCQVAFVDARRLARIRLVDVAAEEMRKTSPLKENGPDPVVDKDIFTVEWLTNLMKSKKVPVKAMLLDQGNISGVGNWVADESLYQGKIHPEQYTNTFGDEQIKQLHDALVYVCTTAVDTLSDSTKFPEDWLMKHRWDKGRKNGAKLPNGEKIVFLTVGGRTSAVVPSRQKKTGAVKADVDDADAAEEGEDEDEVEAKPAKKPAKRGTKKAKADNEDEVGEEDDTKPAKKSSKRARKEVKVEKDDDQADDGAEEEEPAAKKQKATPKKEAKAQPAPKSKSKAKKEEAADDADSGRRRSTRSRN